MGVWLHHQSPGPATLSRQAGHPHFHGIVWGPNLRRLRKLLVQRKGRFHSGFDGIKALDIRSLPAFSDLVSVTCYCLKSPIMGYRVIKRKNQTFKLTKAKMALVGHLRLFRILRGFPFGELMIAGGEGTAISRQIRQTFGN